MKPRRPDALTAPIAGNREAESALVYLALTADGMLGDLLTRVEPEDFYYTECRFVFSECVAMSVAKLPLTDKAAQVSWFKRPEVIHRMKQAKLDWFTTIDGVEQPIAATEILEICYRGDFASLAHLEWYIQELRRMRLVRAFRFFACQLHDKASNSVQETLEFIDRAVVKLKKLAEPLTDLETRDGAIVVHSERRGGGKDDARKSAE